MWAPNLPESGQSLPMLGASMRRYDVPLDPARGGVLEVGARLHRIRVEDFRRRHAQPHEDVELGDGGDLEAGALLDQHLEHARIGIRLDGEVRPHARQRRAETPRLGAHDVEVHEEDRALVAVLGEVLLDPREVEADFWVGVEGKFRRRPEAFDRRRSWHRGLGDLLPVKGLALQEKSARSIGQKTARVSPFL
jgi:hypothetical protein